MRKNEELMTIVAVAIVFALMVGPVQAQEGPVSYEGIEFPLGDVSFADKVVGFNPGSRTGESDGSAAVGPPDGGKGTGPSVIGDKGDVTLGNGGSITLEFTDNYLIDVEGLDLYVFEYGPDVEPFKVEISKDGSGWIDLGTVRGQPTGLDIHGKVAPGDRFSYVRITDANPYAPRDPKIIGQSSYVGADIDAVGAIGAEERPDSDEDGVPDVTELPPTPTPTPTPTTPIGEPATQGQTGTEGEYECPQDARQAYQQYIAAYNRLTSLMAKGKGDTPEAQEAYQEYAKAKTCYESRISGTEPPPTPTLTPTPTPDGEQQRLYPVADGDVYAYSYRNWNWANLGLYGAMGAGWHPTGGEKRAYLRFDLPAGLDIGQAVLKLYQNHRAGPVHSLGVYRVTSPWEEGTGTYHSGEVEETAAASELCWMQQPSFDPVPVATFTSATAVPAWVEVDITSLVQQWQGGTPNYGLVVKTTNEHPTASDPEAKSGFCTKEHTDQANRPVLELSLTVQAQQLKVSDLRGFLNTDNDCNLYVADWSDNQVKMINPDGSTTTHASGIDRPRYQVFDSAGNLHMGSFDGNIYKISTSGVKTVIASGIWSPQGMGFDSAGNLYVAGGYDGKIHRVAPDGSKTTMNSGFTNPKHLVVYSDGNIYVVDSSGTLIVRITPEGGKANLVDLGETINGMATDGEYFYVSHSDKISRIDAFGQVTHIAIGLDQPTHLAVCNGNVFVTVKDGVVKMKTGGVALPPSYLLKSGSYKVEAYMGHAGHLWPSTWTLQVTGNQITGSSEWSCCPGHRIDTVNGRIEGNQVIIERDCTGQGFVGPCHQVYNGTIKGDVIEGQWTGDGGEGRWKLYLGAPASYPEATLTHSGFDFSEGTIGEYPTYDGEVIYWQPGAATHPDYPRDSGYLWWRNTHLDDVNFASQTKDMGAIDIATVREVPAEWDKSPLIPPLLMGHTIVAKCYDGYVKFQVISADPADESARVKYWYSPDTAFDDTIS